ncbi:transcription termination factor 2, mitochondrial [Brachionichthys hirsutus]|uniref:transcription termination factor 2, mitochondrial n=1 Tax=Brachionichthys hirsutus TaxID=412623 RepID=UPI0036047CE8
MLRVAAASLCSSCQRLRLLLPPTASASTVIYSTSRPENRHTVDSLGALSVDVRKIRESKGWILSESSAFVAETADLLRDMGADTPAVVRILEAHPEAVLCRPEEISVQRDLWESVCPDKLELLRIVEKFPATFFTLTHHGNQRANILYLQSLWLGDRIIGELMGSAPQSLSRPVERNKEAIHALRETYLDLGGDEVNLHLWLRTLFGQNPGVLLQPAEAWRDGLGFLRQRGFTAPELLSLASNLRASVAELKPHDMQQALAFVEEAFACTQDELKRVAIRCPAILRCSFPALVGRFQALSDAGVSAEQVKESPGVLELPTHILLHRVQKMAACDYDVRFGSLDVLLGTREDFEMKYWKLQLRQQRLL